MLSARIRGWRGRGRAAVRAIGAYACALLAVSGVAAAQEASAAHATDPRAWHAAAQLEVLARAAEYARGIEPAGDGFVRPVLGPVSSFFGWRDLSVAGNRFHGGVDLVAPSGSPVAAARGGTVVFVGWAGAYGYAVYLDHEGGWQTRYAHLSRIDVRVGDRVRQGAQVGAVGSTGASTGPHVHFEIRHEGRALDPFGFVPR